MAESRDLRVEHNRSAICFGAAVLLGIVFPLEFFLLHPVLERSDGTPLVWATAWMFVGLPLASVLFVAGVVARLIDGRDGGPRRASCPGFRVHDGLRASLKRT
jgi:O-antigen/teichoic acid export membrane protein